MNKKGFTLIELLVVVLIIGILSSVALPQYTTAVEKARSAEAWTVIKAINDAEKIKNLEMGTEGVVYPLDELSVSFEGEIIYDGFQTKNFGYGVNQYWSDRVGGSKEPAMAVRKPDNNWYVGNNDSIYYTLNFRNGKKVCGNGGKDWCKKILSGSVSSSSGCITGGYSSCFSE